MRHLCVGQVRSGPLIALEHNARVACSIMIKITEIIKNISAQHHMHQIDLYNFVT